MIKCYTSAATIKANLKELLKIKDSCEKLKTNQEAIVSTSSNKRVKRQKSSESVTCATYITQVTVLNVVSIWKLLCNPLIVLFLNLGSSKYKSYWARIYHCHSIYNYYKGVCSDLQCHRNSFCASQYCDSQNCNFNCQYFDHPIPDSKWNSYFLFQISYLLFVLGPINTIFNNPWYC